ncbi:class I SAM-dependent methyltransferase [Nonomuraea sp. NPDC049695]|uniref:class I SAM-dependent methyltransferase n=1 Tax=Nonomuraea sp. NPDC049695 TaxID=3154734 RepID=UPI00341FD483
MTPTTSTAAGEAVPAVASQLAFLTEWLPPAPARVLDAGCGRGHLALALARAGYTVAAVDIDPEAVAATTALGVAAIESDIADYNDRAFDAIVFSLSLHHTARLAEAVERARALLAPGGILIVDEFAWERADRATASWFYDIGAVLAGTGLTALPEHGAAVKDPHAKWVNQHRDEHRLHSGDTMVDAIRAAFEIHELVRVPYLHRYLANELNDDTATRLFASLQQIEQLRITHGDLTAVGLRLLAHPANRESQA